MSLLFMDSFDHYAFADILEKWSASAISGTGSAISLGAVGRHSSNGFRWVTGSSINPIGYISKVIPATTTIIFGFGFNHTGISGTAGQAIASFDDSSANQITLRLNNTGSITVTRGTLTGTVLGTTSAALTIGIYNYIECKIVFSNTIGTVDIRFNGVNVLSLTGQDTVSTVNVSINTVTLGANNTTSSANIASRNYDYDDLYICDGVGAAPWNDFLGDVRVDARFPTAPGATTGWTPSAGANWQNVDDATPDDDTTYNSVTAIATDTFVVQDAPVVGAPILGIQHCISAKKMDAGTANIAPVVRHSGADNVGTDFGLGTSYGYLTAINYINPGTGVAWTEAGFNAAEFGYKKTA